MDETIFRPGTNCLGTFKGDGVDILIDAEAYFDALVEALECARHSIYIAGWALDPLVELTPDDASGKTRPLESFLRSILSRNQTLEIHILIWDFARAMTVGRRPWQFRRARWFPSRRIHFRFDNAYPLGGCHHQKFVVIDDQLAFCGGYDLTIGRWDTRHHLPEDSRRTDPQGIEHGPFHDAQVRLEGESARAIGELFRERWAHVCAEQLRVPKRTARVQARPGALALNQSTIALARTTPVPEDDQHFEVEQLFLDMIRAADDLIYIENQYFTCTSVGEAIAERLADPSGPEVIVVGPRETANWIEEFTVGQLRWRVIERVREADTHGRLRFYYPMASKSADVATYVHIKLMIIDDTLIRIGSANLSSRSMRVDSELDVAILLGVEERGRAHELLHDLVAEHFGLGAEEVSKLRAKHSSLRESLDELVSRGLDQTLVELEEGPDSADRWMAEEGDMLFDPREPLEVATLLDRLVGDGARTKLLSRLPFGFMTVVLTSIVLAGWRLAELDDPGVLAWVYDHLIELGDSPLGWLVILLLSALALGVGSAPFLVVLILVTAFGFLQGFLLSYLASLIGALFTFGLGRVLDRNLIMKLVGYRSEDVRRRLFQRGFFSVALLHLAPISRFPTVGVAAGSTDMRTRSYVLGSATGLLPFVLILALVASGVSTFLRTPGIGSGIAMFLGLGALWGLIYGIQSTFEVSAPAPAAAGRIEPGD